MEQRLKQRKTRLLFKRAERALVGGVDSPVRAFNYIGGDPVLIRNGRGSKVYDYDKNEYIDYVLSYGALILGHARPEIKKAIKKVVDSGAGFGSTHESEVKLAERIRKVTPILERIRFVNSGTEAVMGAVRLARGITRKNKVIKFEGAYHGHADYLLAKAGSGLATLSLPSSAGIPTDFVRHTLSVPYGDMREVSKIFDEHGNDIACVLVEPVGGNNGVVRPDIAFLKKLRTITKERGALLIFDEVITAFRFHFGLAADYFGVKPDIVTLGKIIGGGLPIGAYGSGAKIMEKLAPLGNVYQASTFAGNPVVMQAGLAALDVLATVKSAYRRLEKKTQFLSKLLENYAAKNGIYLTVRHFGSMFSLHFEKKEHFKEFYKALLKQGVYLAPSEYESNFVSFAHSEEDIKKTLRKANEALGAIAQKPACRQAGRENDR